MNHLHLADIIGVGENCFRSFQDKNQNKSFQSHQVFHLIIYKPEFICWKPFDILKVDPFTLVNCKQLENTSLNFPQLQKKMEISFLKCLLKYKLL